MKQNPPRLQHYVPQFLLRRFANGDGRLCAYDTKRQKIFWCSPKGLAVEEYFYGESADAELWLAKEIDSPGTEAIDSLLAKQTLPRAQVNAFFRFVATQMLRTPASLQRATDCFAPTFQETAERIAKYDPMARNNIIASVKATGATDEEISELVQILDAGKFVVTPTRDFAISIGFSILELVVAELAKMRWMFLDVHSTDGDLIIGDHPVTLADVAPEGLLPGPLGVTNPHIEIAMPLSPRMIALAHWNGPISYGELAPGMSDMFNKRALQNANRFVFASSESEKMLEQAILLRETGPKMRTFRSQIGEQLIVWTEFRQ